LKRKTKQNFIKRELTMKKDDLTNVINSDPQTEYKNSQDDENLENEESNFKYAEG
jgi:hypothetical protein